MREINYLKSNMRLDFASNKYLPFYAYLGVI